MFESRSSNWVGALRTTALAERNIIRRFSLPIVVTFLALGFVCLPFPFEHKAHTFLHGLCAQRPSHSFSFGDRALPFDARMTGIYAGLLCSLVVLTGMGRHRAGGLPAAGSGAILLGFVGIMAVDGFNSLFKDIGFPFAYEPDNRLRLITGWGSGIAIGCVMTMLAGMTLWQSPRTHQHVVSRWWHPLALLLPLVPFWLVLRTENRLAYYLVTGGLLLAAIVAVTILVLVVLLLMLNKENSFVALWEVEPPAVVSLLLAVAIILMFAGARFLLEDLTNAPPLV